MKIDINRDLITDRMNQYGFSERSIIQATQIAQTQFRQARQNGHLDGHITLAQLHRLATQLGLATHELLAMPAATPADDDENPMQVAATDDVAELIPLLLAVPRLISIAHVARNLGWTRERVNQTLDRIPEALDGTGLRLDIINSKAKIAPAHSSAANARTIARLQTSTAGINASQARALRRIINGDPILKRNIGTTEQLVIGALKNMGCIELDDQARYRPSADLRLALPDIG